MQKLVNRMSHMERKRAIQFLIRDTVLVSYPKSGRTWLRMMLTKLLVDMGYSNKNFEMLLALHAQPGGIVNDFSKDVRVIFLYRNIGDVVMSFYWESITSDRNGIMAHTDPYTFIRDPKFGLPNIGGFYNLWFEHISNFKDHMFVTYEDLHNNTTATLYKIVEFLAAPREMPTWTYEGKPEPPKDPFENFSEKKLLTAIEYSRFENMKKIEMKSGSDNLLQNYKGNFGNFGIANKEAQGDLVKKAHPSLIKFLKSKGIDPNRVADIDKGRLRKGKINGYYDDLTKEDIEYVKSIEAKINFPNSNVVLDEGQSLTMGDIS